MYTEDTEEYQGFTVSIVHDDDPESPRDWDNLGTMITWERNYSSPDTNQFATHDHDMEWSEWSDRAQAYVASDSDGSFLAFLSERRRERKSKDAGVIVLALSRNDYDGSISADEYDEDDAPEGVIYITYEDIRKEYSVKHITPKTRALVLAVLRGEVETYSQYATGDVWGYVVSDGEDDHIDSCWGYYGTENALTAGKEAIDYLVFSGRIPVPQPDEDAAD